MTGRKGWGGQTKLGQRVRVCMSTWGFAIYTVYTDQEDRGKVQGTDGIRISALGKRFTEE